MPFDEAKRLAIVHELELLDTPCEPAFDALAESAARLAGCEVGYVTLLDASRQWVKAAWGAPAGVSWPRASAFCQATLARGTALEVHDARADAAFGDLDFVRGPQALRYYAGWPLHVAGAVVGTLCVVDRAPRALDPATRGLLARQAEAASALLGAARLTRLQQREQQRLLDFARASGDWMWETDGALRYTWIAGAVEAVTGFAADELLGQPMRDAPRLDSDGSLHDVLRAGRAFSRVTTREATPRGALAISRSGVPVREPEGRIVGWRGTARDMTPQIEAEQLRRDRDAAERASRAKSAFLSRVSHELRTPLNGILGFTQLMALDREAPLSPVQLRRLEGVQRAGRHLLELVDDLLDLTRLEQGTANLASRNVDLLRALGHALAMVRPLADEQRIELPPEPANGPCSVRADPRALEHVLVNLLANAVQFNRPQGHVTIAIHADAGAASLTVIDEGPGLDTARQREVFQPFAPSYGAARGRREGRGLGLAIAHELMLAMGGALTVASTPGEGARFTLTLPRGDDVDPDSGPIELLSRPAALEDDAPGCRRVLYIEDEPLNALLMEEVFRDRSGWALQVERDGANGAAWALEHQPDLVLVDMNLPDMTGLDVIAALRRHPAGAALCCVALSADAMPEQVQAAREAGFIEYWTKPIDVARMLEAIERVVRERSA